MTFQKRFLSILVVSGCVLAAWAAGAADEPDGLRLPAGFHARVVAEALGPIRHLAVRSNGDIYVSTLKDAQGKGGGIIALHLDTGYKADQVEHFGTADGTGIRFYNGALYASSASGVYRYTFSGDVLVPQKEPDLILDGMPSQHPGFNRANRPIAFDGKGNLYVALDANGNFCTEQVPPQATKPVGLKPCPDLQTRAGVWRFNANKIGQRFPSEGEHLATGIRDITSLDWSAIDNNLYGIMHGRDNSNRLWPEIFSAEDEDHIADEMHRITKGTDFGWPYTYFDGVRNVRLIAPEYGGDGKKTPPAATYSTPVLTFHSRRAAPVDLMFYTGDKFPASYRGGAFIVLHGTANRTGYNVAFVPFNKNGRTGDPTVFADGFAAFDPAKPGPARYRPVGIALGPDGAMYIADSQKGRVWRIEYTGE